MQPERRTPVAGTGVIRPSPRSAETEDPLVPILPANQPVIAPCTRACPWVDQGIEVEGRANFVPADPDVKAFSRTPQQVLRIVYLTDQAGVARGGLFPNGMNGALRTT